MNPYSEESLTEEVLYLHSLWRRGPPRNPNLTHTHNPSSTTVANAANPNPSRKRPKDPKNPNHNKKKKPRPEPPQDSGLEWPCSEPVQNQPSTSSGWPPIEPRVPPVAQPLSSEDRENLAALRLQYKCFEACREFFTRNADSGSDEGEEDEEEEEEEEEGNNGEIIGSEEYLFFLKMFVENDELRGYYEKHCEGGSFCCLVCGGIGKKKSGKKFKDCMGLLQHSILISNTKKKRAHRAFGLVVCRVFGWDIDRIPVIVLKGEPLGRSLADSRDSKVQLEENHVAEEHESGVHNENVPISNDDDGDKMNEMMISVDGNGQKLEEEKPVEDPDSNAKDLISGENEDACKENVVNVQAEKAENSISVMGESNAEMELPVSESISKACKDFFAAFTTSTGDDGAGENSLINGDGLEELEEFKFFIKLFIENENLRRYYEHKYDDGEFFCLACVGVVDKKRLKSFRTCGRLLQHTTSLATSKIGENPVHEPHIAKLMKMKTLAHRAYGLVICKVLGWDIEKLPAVVLKGEPLGRSLTKSGVSMDDSVGDAVGNTKELSDRVEDDSTKTNKSMDESVADAVGTTNDDLAKVNEVRGESVVGNMNDLDGVKENQSMKVDVAALM